MSEYQYYEFCNLNQPMTKEVRDKMMALSSRTRINTHGAAYVYNYGDFRGNPKELLSKYFDVFFYITNWGTVQLMFRYPQQRFDANIVKPYHIKHIIEYEESGQYGLLDIQINNEEGGDWIEGEGLLTDLVPLYNELLSGDDSFLYTAAIAAQAVDHVDESVIKNLPARNELYVVSEAQKSFLELIGLDQIWIDKHL